MYYLSMQIDSFDTIGTHITIHIDTLYDCDTLFSDIRKRLSSFEEKYSRFIVDNWLDQLNRDRHATLDTDGDIMLSTALDIAEKTG
jgi:exonuclease V gamma subunit